MATQQVLASWPHLINRLSHLNINSCQCPIFKYLNSSLKTHKANLSGSNSTNSTRCLFGKWCKRCKTKMQIRSKMSNNLRKKFLITQRAVNTNLCLEVQVTHAAVLVLCIKWALVVWFHSCMAHRLQGAVSNRWSWFHHLISLFIKARSWVSSPYLISSLGLIRTPALKWILCQRRCLTPRLLGLGINKGTSHSY